MVELLRVSDFIRPGQASRTATFEGEPYGGHHGFTNTGDGRLRMLGLHASPRIIQFDLE